jgi:hypothetical protein
LALGRRIYGSFAPRIEREHFFLSFRFQSVGDVRKRAHHFKKIERSVFITPLTERDFVVCHLSKPLYVVFATTLRALSVGKAVGMRGLRESPSTSRIQSNPFGFTLPDGNVFDDLFGQEVEAGTYFPSVDDGYYMLIKAQPPGSHLLHFHVTIVAFGFTLDIPYQLTVTP